MDEEDVSIPRLPKKLTSTRLGIFERQEKVGPTQRQAGDKMATSEKPTYQPTKKQVPPNIDKSSKTKEHPLPDNQIFQSPMVLVSTVDGKTKCEESTLAKLNEIEQPLNIVSVVGTLRTGKSFLLNKLARHSSADANSWFETGHTTNAVTKGIWILCRPHPTQKDQVLVLLDTEGIDDPDKIDIEDDKNLFLLATLLSSTMVYNTRGNFDRNAIDKFKNSWGEPDLDTYYPPQKQNLLAHMKCPGDSKDEDIDSLSIFLSRIKTSIKVSGSEEDDSILDFFFPNFVLTLRDITLAIDAEDDDTFLENTLKLKRLKKGSNTTKESLKEFNLPRMLIRRYFKKRKCFRFRKPVKTAQLNELMTIPETCLKEGFQKTLNEFRDFVLSCQPKVLKSGRALNGRMFSTLLLNYVTSVQKNEPPCLTSAMKSMAAVENTHVVKKATDVYNAEMKRRIGSYTPTDAGLVNYHKDSMQAALEVLKAGLIIDDEQIYEDQALACFKSHFEKIKTNVKEDLEEKCWMVLHRLDTIKIQAKIKKRQYCTRTGYDDYLKDLDTVTQQFNSETGYMGSVARSVLKEYLDRKGDEEEIVCKMVMEADDRQEGEELKRQKIKRATIYREEDEMILKQEEDAEEAIRADIESIQVNGLQNIGRQYRDILRTKIEEVDRVKQELTRSNSYYFQLCKETKHWKDIFDKTTWKMPQTGERERENMQRTVFEEPWEDAIGPLWKKVMEDSTDEENISLTSQDSLDLNRDKDGITVLPDRIDTDGISDDPVYCDQAVGIQGRKKGKCDIM